MKVTIITDDGEKLIYELEDEQAIVGRGDQCSIQVANEHISRKHLGIYYREGNFFIKDLTLSNWVSYNGDKLPKNEEVQYYDFSPLILPGKLTVKIKESSDETMGTGKVSFGSSQDKTRTSISATGSHRYEKEKVTLEKPVIDHDSNEKARRVIRQHIPKFDRKKRLRDFVKMVIAFIAVVFTLFYLLNTEDLPQETSETIEDVTIPKKVDRKSNNIIKIAEKKTENQIKFEKVIKSQERCKYSIDDSICRMVLVRKGDYEGALSSKGVLYITKNFDRRLSFLLKSTPEKIELAKQNDIYEKIVASENILNTLILEKLEQNQIFYVKVFLYDKIAKGVELRSIYRVDTNLYRRFENTDYAKATKEIKNLFRTNTYERVFGKLVQKEKI